VAGVPTAEHRQPARPQRSRVRHHRPEGHLGTRLNPRAKSAQGLALRSLIVLVFTGALSNMDFAASLGGGPAGGGQVAFAVHRAALWRAGRRGRPGARGRSPTSRWWWPPRRPPRRPPRSPSRRTPRTGNRPRWPSAAGVSQSAAVRRGPHLDGVSAHAAPVGDVHVENGPLFIGKSATESYMDNE
jgi:hypothetical protein